MTHPSSPCRSFEDEPHRIAVMRALYLGDLLLSVPALRAMRTRFPAAEITLIGLPWAAAFVERFQHLVDRFLPFPGYPGIGEVSYNERTTARFLAEQRDYGYGLIMQMHGSGQTSNPFARALGGAITVGYVVGDGSSGLDLAAPYPETLHEIDRNLRLVGLLGCATEDRALEFPIAATDRSEASDLIGQTTSQPLVVLHPGAKFSARRWMPERFAAVADALVERLGARVIVSGASNEQPVIDAVISAMGRREHATSLAGQTSLGGLAAIIERCDLFVSNDTGPAHIAAALGRPSIVLFGPADVRRWAPLDVGQHRVIREAVVCSPCGFEDCPIDHRCLRSIEPERVIATAVALLGTRQRNETQTRKWEIPIPCAG